ncbi:hypothetical protein [Acinetobacter baumannii]|uniref:hypothetical protein n=1 Tax=Acinetobacter baumannii TaxID=470 RepID=UPI000A33EDD3|nr:hypothetical protein [Acinetobacter baumannii]OTK49831.1 hypothetical protein B9X70_10990 [Acinetobacter baumannii]OTM36400.1 hypothetical protein B9X47_03580 [Acinetobacter baumannii]
MSASLKTCYGYQTTRCDLRDIHQGTINLPHYAQSVLSGGDATIDKNDEVYQWLTDGYYFWLNSDRYAMWWGEGILRSDYLVTRYEISLDREDVYDLLENPDDEDDFFFLVERYLKKYEESKKIGINEEMPEPTVSTILHFFRTRHPEIFPYLAITITDNWIAEPVFRYIGKHKTLKMTPKSRTASDRYRPMGRPQICVFEDAKSFITSPQPIYPKQYVDIFGDKHD